MRAGKPIQPKKGMGIREAGTTGRDGCVRVMLAEEKPGRCSWIVPLLEENGYLVATGVRDGEDIAGAALREHADVVLADSALGKTGGISALTGKIRRHAGIPVIVLANSAGEAGRIPEAQKRPYGFLEKPAGSGEVRLAIEVNLCQCEARKKVLAAQQALQKLKSHTDALIEQRTSKLKKTNARLHRLLHYLEVSERRMALDAMEIDLYPETILTDSEDAGIITTGTDHRVVLMSEAAGERLGWPYREQAGKDIGDLLVPGDSYLASRLGSDIDTVVASGTTGITLEDLPIRTRSGETLAMNLSLEPIAGEGRTVSGVLITLGGTNGGKKQDFGWIKKQYPASLNLMVKGIAHDFNNILSSVLANIQLARTGTRQGTPAYDRLSLAETGILRAREISEQMLTCSRGDTAREEPADLAGVLKKVSTQVAGEAKVRCTFSIAGDVREIPLDEDLIRQIFGYLFRFLAGFLPENGILDISADTVTPGTPDQDLPSPAGYVRIRLGTDVSTMPSEQLDAIAAAGSSPPAAAGLSVAESMIRRSGGVLQVRRRTGSGIEISLNLPARYQKPAARTGETVSPPAPKKGGARQKILLMDDEDAILSATSEMLKFLGYEVAVSHGGEEAAAMYGEAMRSEKPFDAVILDITIPGGLGAQETLPKLLALDPGVKAIISSGYSTNPMMVDYRSFGFTAAISKPYGFRELGNALGIAFGKR